MMSEAPYRLADFESDRATLAFRPNTLLVPAGLRLRRNKLVRGADAATVATIDAAYGRLLKWLEACAPALEQGIEAVPEPMPEPLNETVRDDTPDPTIEPAGQGGTVEPGVSADWAKELEAQRQRHLKRRAPRQRLQLEGPKVTLLPPERPSSQPVLIKPKGWFGRR